MYIGIYGFGAIGKLIAKYAIERGYEVVGVVDIDQSMIGRDIGELLGFEEKYGVEVSSEVSVLGDADVVFHATGSYLDKVYPQLKELIELGVDILSTCETLAYPYHRYPVLARKLDEYAKLYSTTLLGTGINPGFIMDTLVITLSTPFTSIKRIHAVRSLDAGKRRIPFRRKIGVGDKPEIVREKMEKGELTGHVGYAESVYLIADALDLELTRVKEYQDVLIAEQPIATNDIIVEHGLVKGIKGYGIGYYGDQEVIRLELYAYVGAEDYEEITIEGREYTVKWRSTGTPGDQGTVAVLLNLAEKIGYYGPGLITMVDILPFKPYVEIK